MWAGLVKLRQPGAAGAFLAIAPLLIVFLFAQRYLVSGLTRGGVKG